MNIAGYDEMMRGLECGEPESAKNAIKALCAVLKNAVNSQYLLPYQNDEFKMPMNLACRLLDSIEDGALSIVPGSHTPVADDDIITRSSYEQHWQDKGKSFHDEIAKSIGEFKKLEDIAKEVREREAGDEVKCIEKGIQKAKQERAIFECKAAAFDEIAGEMASVYRAVHALDGSFDSDNDRNNVPYATMRAMFSLGIVAEIINKTKEDVVNVE